MLQALYFCKPFREKVLEYKAKNKKGKETLLSCLADLFYSIATQKKKVGTIAPKKFIARLRKEKVDFDNYMQQDAHEFLNFLINHINEIIVCKSIINYRISSYSFRPWIVSSAMNQFIKWKIEICGTIYKLKKKVSSETIWGNTVVNES